MKRRNQMISFIIASIVCATTYITNLNSIKAYAQANTTGVSVSESKTEKIKQKIISELKNYNQEIYFDSSYGITNSKEIQNLFYDVLYENPEIFWVSLNIANTPINNGSTTLYVRNIYDNAAIDTKRTELRNKVKEITDKYKSYSELRQEYEISDYIMDNATYDNDIVSKEMPSSSLSTSNPNYLEDEKKIAKENYSYFESHSAYGALMNGLCVCEGYSKALTLLLKQYGIESGIVKNDVHGWNYVKISDKYYHIDLTYDDAKDEKTPYPYKYFNITTDQMSVDHTWTTANIPSCTDTTFDNIFRKKAGSSIMGVNVVRVEDKLYSLEYVSGYNYNICKMDLDGSNKEVVKSNMDIQYLLKHDTDLYYTLYNSTSGTITIEKYDTTTGETSTFLDLKKEFGFTSGTWATSSYIKNDKIFVTFRIGGSSATAVTKEFNLNSGSIVSDLDKAVTAVIKAEGSKKQADVDSAKTLVNALEDGSDKDSLLQRLQVVQVSIDKTNSITNAINAVTKAETSKLQADVDSSKTLVEALEDGSDKISLLQRLQAVQDIINNKSKEQQLNDATNAVIKAESSKSQTDVDSAKVLVETLTDGSNKTSLLVRLESVQGIIDGNKDKEQKLSEATELVSKAETSKLQADVDSAKILVEALEDGSDKTSLFQRLQTVQGIINSNKNKEQQLNDATNAVIKAETSKSQADVNSAKASVGALEDGSNKTSLLVRLEAVQGIIDGNKDKEQKLSEVTELVSKAETSKLQADVNSAKTLVEALTDSSDKKSLLQRLKVVQTMIDNDSSKDALKEAITAVEKAEGSKSQTDINSAKALVETLAGNNDKTSLLARLQVVQNKINDLNTITIATAAVAKAESTKTKSDYETAFGLVNSLENNTEKTALLDRLNTVKIAIDNGNKNNSSNTNNNSGKDNNNSSNKKDNNGSSKKDDEDEEDNIDIKDTKEYKKAEHMLEVFEGNLDEAYYEDVEDAIDKVKDSDEKDDLLDELKKYKKKMNSEDSHKATGKTKETYYEPSNITTGWIQYGMGKWSFVNPQGWKTKGIQAINGQTYRFDDSGFLITGWYYDSFLGEWYYFNPNSSGYPGELVTGWLKIDGKWYYLNPNKYGAMERNTTINGYKLNGYGAMIG